MLGIDFAVFKGADADDARFDAFAGGRHAGNQPSVTLDEQVELLSLIGDVAMKDGEPVVHAHAVVGKKDGTAHGGHLLEACIRPTCEVVLTESPAHLQKYIDPESRIAVIKPLVKRAKS
jgi:predicted DNA-binding protein with PD1-like motif